MHPPDHASERAPLAGRPTSRISNTLGTEDMTELVRDFQAVSPPTCPWAPGVRGIDVPITPGGAPSPFAGVGDFDYDFGPASGTDELTVLRSQLHSNGYHPVPQTGKAPNMQGWVTRCLNATPADIAGWGQWSNTGLLTRDVPTFDVDILNPEAAVAIEELVRRHYEERGHLMVRIGLPPKRAIPFKTDEPFKKITIVFASGEKLEFLGDGQQVVVAGIHPDTNKPYAWFGGEPWTVARDDLPSITEGEARELMELAADLVVTEFGYVRTSGRPRESRDNTWTADFSTAEPVSDYRKAAYGQAALANIAAELASTPEGNRSDHACKLAFNAGRLVAGGCLTESGAYDRLSSAALSWGIPASDKALGQHGTIARAIRKGTTEGKPAGPTGDGPRDESGFGYFGYDPETGEVLDDPDEIESVENAVEIWCQGATLHGTLAEAYLRSRGIEVPDEALDALRFHPECPWGQSTVPALVALVRDKITGEPVGSHLTALTPEGRRLGCMTLGPIAGHDLNSAIDRRVCKC
jgi:Bifunctional DNA primase/polymerase, N-terminal